MPPSASSMGREARDWLRGNDVCRINASDVVDESVARARVANDAGSTVPESQ